MRIITLSLVAAALGLGVAFSKQQAPTATEWAEVLANGDRAVDRARAEYLSRRETFESTYRLAAALRDHFILHRTHANPELPPSLELLAIEGRLEMLVRTDEQRRLYDKLVQGIYEPPHSTP